LGQEYGTTSKAAVRGKNGKTRKMNTQSTQEQPAGAVSIQEQSRPVRLNFSNPQQRSAHSRAFWEWLPKILHEAPGVQWESLPSSVMGYLIRNVANSPDAIPITLAVGYASHLREKVMYSHCKDLRKLLQWLRDDYEMTTLTELSQRSIWDRFVEGRMITSGELQKLKRYAAFSSTHRQAFESELTERQKMIWQPYLLPPLPHGFLEKKAQNKAILTAAENRRKEQSDIILPLFPLLVEIAQLRKQAAQRLIMEFRKQRDRAEAGEVELPHQFQYTDRQFSVSEHVSTLSEVQLIEREVTLTLTLWKRTQWVKKHPELYKPWVHKDIDLQRNAYATEHNTYFLQYEGPASNLLWCGDLIEKQLLGQGKRLGFWVRRPTLLTPDNSDTKWLRSARKLSGAVLFEPESLYRGVLFATALATLSLTNGARVSELLQVSASRFETIVVDELKNQQPTGRKIGICVQKLLPKGYTHESERQFFLISDMAVRHIKEIGELLRATHDGIIPVVRPEPTIGKAEDLLPEPYFFQWAASSDGQVGHLCSGDVAHLLRFLFHGLTLTTRAGEPIRIAPHLLRHVLATHARTVQNIPAEALAYLLHHRVTLHESTHALTLPEATAYYSRLPVAKLLALLAEVQSALVSGQGHSYLHVPPPQTLEQGEEALRKQFERCGMIGPTVLGFCSAGTCVRPDNRGICANCPFLVPHYSNLPKAKTWLKLYELQAKLHDDQGHAVDAEQMRKVCHYLKDMIRVMEIQIRTRQDGGYLPFADTLPPAQNEEGDER
jgi:hypothetical protein